MARYSAPKPVIFCISPLFLAEQWQVFLMQVHVSNRFGAHLHIYIGSLIDSYFELIKEYEKLGYLTMDYWVKMKFAETSTPFYEPNSNVEWRNQAGAQIDCLLQYKEAAEYIAFFDIDDILIPRTYTSYLKEFNAEWKFDWSSNSIYYERKEYEFLKADTLSEFSFKDVVSSLRSSPFSKIGKVVVKPDRYNSTWIHYSWHDLNRRSIKSPSLIHLRRPIQRNGDNIVMSIWNSNFSSQGERIRLDDIEQIEIRTRAVITLPEIAEIGQRLPSRDYYTTRISRCFYKKFYKTTFDHLDTENTCPNADKCEMPQIDDNKCIHSDAEYHSGPSMQPFTFHFATNFTFSTEIGCYQ